MTYKELDTVVVPPALCSDAIIVTSGSALVHSSSTMDEPKASSSLPKDTTEGVSLKGVQIKEPSSDGGTCGGGLERNRDNIQVSGVVHSKNDIAFTIN